MKGVTDLIRDEGDQADLTALIDCVFLLLLFFIVTSVFSEQTFFEVDLPTAMNAEVVNVENALVLSVSANGNFAVAERLLSDAELGPYIEALHAKSPIGTFVINGHKEAPYERVAMAIDIAQGLKVGQLTFTVE